MRAQEEKLGVWGLVPGKIFQDHALQIVGKRSIFWRICLERSKRSRLVVSFPTKVSKKGLKYNDNVDYFELHNIKSASLINSCSFFTYRSI